MWLQQSTATTIPLGPFVDETDGKTPETALTISQADVRLSKVGGNFAQKNGAAALVHNEFGYYPCGLDATDTATLGRLHIAVTESGALPFWTKFLVIPANEFASLVLGTDALEVDVTQIEGSDATDTLLAQAAQALTNYDAPTAAELTSGLTGLNDIAASDVLEQAAQALTNYDPPTAAELTSGLSGLNDLAAGDILTQASQALTYYDAPTKAELDAGFSGLNDLAAADVLEQAAQALTNYDPATHAELTSGLAGLNNLAAADVLAQAAQALTNYDAPTAAELTAGLAALNDIAAADVLTSLIGASPTAGSLGEAVLVTRQVAAGKLVVDSSESQEAYYDTNGSTVLVTLTHADDTPAADDITRTVS